jgi:hypothetical protein
MIVGAVLALFVGLFFIITSYRSTSKFTDAINSFEECVARGYPVAESLPRQCKTKSGKNFVEDTDTNSDSIELEFVTISQSTLSQGKSDSRNLVVNTRDAWQSLWSEVSDDISLPNIDMSEYVVIAVFSGIKGSGGHGITISKAFLDPEKKLNVKIIDTSPGINCITTQAVTYPYHIIAVKLPYPNGIDRSRYKASLDLEHTKFDTSSVIIDC